MKNGFKNINYGEVLLDGAIGGITAAIGGKGSGTKHLNNLGKQTVKRTTNAFTHKGAKAAAKEARKAFAYYTKNTNSYYRKFFTRDIWKDVASNTINPFAKEYIYTPLLSGGYSK